MCSIPQRENHKTHAAYIRLTLGVLQLIWCIEVSLNNGPATPHPHPSSAFGELEEFSVITRFWEKEGWRVLPTLYLVFGICGIWWARTRDFYLSEIPQRVPHDEK